MKKTYMIVGASSGIGEACARYIASENTELVLVARNIEKMKLLQEELAGNITYIPYDLRNINDIDNIFNICKEKNIIFDGLIYSAGVDGTWPIKANNTLAMQDMMNVNCLAFVEIVKRFYSKKFSNDNASIVAVSSIASLRLDKGMSSYCASKVALNAYVQVMAKEFENRHIRVNAILPAGVDTPMARKKLQMLSRTDDSLIPAAEVAEKIFYLLSDEAGDISGELIPME